MEVKLQAMANLSGQRIDLDWTWRTSEQQSTRFGLIRREGRYPVAPKDGIRVLDMCVPVDSASSQAGIAIVEKNDPDTGEQVYSYAVADTKLAEGIYYYTLFIDNAPVGRAVAMATGCYGFADQLYQLLPAIHRTFDEPSASDRDKGQLRKFLEIFGLTLDQIRSQAEGLRGRHDAQHVRADFLPHLAQWIGWDLDQTIDEIAQRNEILSAPEIYKTVGTIPGLRALVNRITARDCRIKEFVHNVCLSNAPETLHLWEIWEASYDLDKSSWMEPIQCTWTDNFEGRPACVIDNAFHYVRLFWHSNRNGRRDIWYQCPDDVGATPRQLSLYPGDDVDSRLENVASPSVIIADMDNLWLFCDSGQPEHKDVWVTTIPVGSLDTKSSTNLPPYSAENLSNHPRADDRNPTVVKFFRNQTWVFWQSNRRGPTDIWARVHDGNQWGPPKRITTADLRHCSPAAVVFNDTLWLFYCEDNLRNQGLSRRLACQTFDGSKWSKKKYVTRGPRDESPTAIFFPPDHFWLFWHAQDANNHWQIRGMIFDGTRWNKKIQFPNHPAADKEPTALFDYVNRRLRVFWRSQRRGYFRIAGQSQGKGYPLQSCTIDTRNAEMLAHARMNKVAFENRVHYTYDTRVQTGINNDAWCARNTVGVYLPPDTPEEKQKLVIAQIERFLPVHTRVVLITEPQPHVYTYGHMGIGGHLL